MKCKFCLTEIKDGARCPECGHAQSDNVAAKFLPQNFGSNLACFITLMLVAFYFMFRNGVVTDKAVMSDTDVFTSGFYSTMFTISLLLAALVFLAMAADFFIKSRRVTMLGYKAVAGNTDETSVKAHGTFLTAYKYAPLSHIYFIIELLVIIITAVTFSCEQAERNDFPICRFLNTAVYDWTPLFRWVIMMFSIAFVLTAAFFALNFNLGYRLYENGIVGKGTMLKLKKPFKRVDFDFSFKEISRVSAHGRSVMIVTEGKKVRIVAKNSFEASKLADFINEKREDSSAEFFEEKEPLFSI